MTTIKDGNSYPSQKVTRSRFTIAPIAAAVTGIMLGSTAVAQEEEKKSFKQLEEVTVTATRRAVDIQEVPQSITAFSGADLATMGVKNMEDFVNALPSVNLTASQPGRNNLVMRGISTGVGQWYTDSQVAVYLDDQPMTTSSQQLSVRAIDMERIESLPGPQGTLFGTSSQTGTIRYITNKPNTEGISGHIEAGYGVTKGGDDSYDVNAHLNVPLIDDVLAMRAVAYTSHDGGYVDNVYGESYTGNYNNADVVDENQNEADTVGGRIAVLWQMNENWSGLFSLVGEKVETNGTWESDPYLGDYKVTRFLDEWREDDWYSAAFTLKGDIADVAELSVAIAHYERDIAYNWDNHSYSQWRDSYWGDYYGYNLYNADYNRGIIFNDQEQERDNVEIRLQSIGDSKLQWIAGLYYDDVYDTWHYGSQVEDYMNTTSWATAQSYAYFYSYYNPNQAYPIPPTDSIYAETFDRTVKQTAVFGEVSYEFSDKWSAMVGMRWAEYEREEQTVSGFPLGLINFGDRYDGDGVIASDGKDDDTIFKFDIRYQYNEDVMFYFLHSQGFRLGGANSSRAANASELIPANFDTDTLDNFELGVKSQWWDNRLQINAQLYQMKWEEYQTNLWGSPWWVRGTVNAGDVETLGFEFDVTLQATDNLKVGFNGFVSDTEFKNDYAPAGLEKGNPLANSPDEKYYFSLDYDIPEVLGGDAWIHYDISYMSETWNDLDNVALSNSSDPADVAYAEYQGLTGSTTYSTLSMGLNLPNDLSLTLNVRNLMDANNYDRKYDGWNNDADWFGDPRFHNERTRERPRSVWLTVRKDF